MRFTQWHTTALCSPTRSCLLTGRNHTRNSMACITEAAIGFPNASGTIPPENGDALGDPRRARLEHLHGRQVAPVPDRRDEPRGDAPQLAERPRLRALVRVPRGARRTSGIPTWSTTTTRSTSRARPRRATTSPTTSPTRRIEFIKDAKAIAPEKPFFLYYAPGACHAPHHAPKEWIDKFAGQFDMGYEAMREQTLARQKELGLVPADTELPPLNPIGTPRRAPARTGKPFPPLDYTRPWDSLNADEKRLFSRMAEVYAGFLAHADHHIGRLLDYLEQTGQLENTIIVVVSDNGASGEGGPNGSVNEMKFANGIADDLAENLAKLDDLGGTEDLQPLPNGWAMAFNTPFKMWKRYEFNGGTADPCIISWPAGIKARGEIRHQYHHAIDLVPTILDVLGVEAPETIKGHTQSPFDGVSMRASVDDASAPSAGKTQFYSMLGSRSIWHEGWKAVTTHPTRRRLGPLQRRRMGALPRRGRPVRDQQSRGRAAGEAARAGEHLVRGGRRERRLPARRPLSRWRSSPPPGPS